MITIVWQGDHRYNVYRSGKDIGCITVSHNPYHNTHHYLNLGLEQYDRVIAKELFSLLHNELEQPLQVMLYSTPEMHNFLTAGGFVRRRRCYELEVSPSDLAVISTPSVKLNTAQKGSALYNTCCGLLYAYYSRVHDAVNPLTASLDTFCSALPKTVLCSMAEDKPTHYAFVEPYEAGCEIAYMGTTDISSFSGFAQTLVREIFQKYSSLTAECDDGDPAAMQFMELFTAFCDESYDTYILK